MMSRVLEKPNNNGGSLPLLWKNLLLHYFNCCSPDVFVRRTMRTLVEPTQHMDTVIKP